MVLMIFYMFGGVHPFGDFDNFFWSFMLYALTQMLWIFPLVLFFASVIAWGGIRERLAVILASVGWIINIVAIYFVLNA